MFKPNGFIPWMLKVKGIPNCQMASRFRISSEIFSDVRGKIAV